MFPKAKLIAQHNVMEWLLFVTVYDDIQQKTIATLEMYKIFNKKHMKIC